MLAKDETDGKPKGKVVVLHNGSDKALAASSWWFNSERRVGQRGMGTKTYFSGIYYEPEKHLLDKFKDCHKNEDCNSWAGAYFGTGHSFQYHEKAIDIYEKYAL